MWELMGFPSSGNNGGRDGGEWVGGTKSNWSSPVPVSAKEWASFISENQLSPDL